MKKLNGYINKWRLPVLGIILLLLGYLAWGLFTVSYKAEWIKGMAFCVTIATMACFIGISYCCVKLERGNDVRNQWCAVCSIVMICGVLLALRGGGTLLKEQRFPGLVIEVLWCVVCGYSTFLLSDREGYSAVRTKDFLRKHAGILLLLSITVILCIEPDAFQYRWDGMLYYLTCKELSLQSMSNLAIYGHTAQTFGTLVQMGNIIFRDTRIALYVANVFLMMISIIYFYRIVRHCVPGRTQKVYVVLTAVYAWSPYLLGMVFYYNLDFVCQCLATPVIYYLMKKRWVLFTFFSFLFCFTKEPAIIVYGAICAGRVILDVAEDQGFTFAERMRRCFDRTRYYFMVMPGILWLATYKMLGPWSAGEGGVGFDISYVIEKLKNLYILNFNWVFSFIVLMGIIILFWRKDYELGKLILPLVCAQTAFTVFSCLFRTVNHPRYNDTNQVTLYLLAIILICTYTNKIIDSSWGVLMSILLLISSYYTIDPMSLYIYPTYQVGNATMLTTGDNPLGDFMIYNRQMLGMERALEMAVAEAVRDKVLVCFPAVNNNPYYFDGMAAVGTIAECQSETEYWDMERGVRTPENGADTIEFTVCHIPENAVWPNDSLIPANGQADLIYMDCAGKQCYEEMKKYYSVVQEEEYNYGSWTVRRARFVAP